MKIGIANDTPEMYDFAFSFAGEDRDLVESIKNELNKQNYTVFYDYDIQHKLVGKDLYSYLREIYKNKCKFVVCFLSEYYAKKIWTTLEFTAVKERLMSTFFASDFLIPILIDDSPLLDDIPSFMGFYKHANINATVRLLSNKFESSIVEDNYLINIDNFIEYLCNAVYAKFKKSGTIVKLLNNVISIEKNGVTHRFEILSESEFNIPSILISRENTHHPDLFVSWDRNSLITFNIHYFNQLKPPYECLGIRELVEVLTSYIINQLEL